MVNILYVGFQKNQLSQTLYHKDYDESFSQIDRLIEGGGRNGYESEWYNLVEIREGKEGMFPGHGYF